MLSRKAYEIAEQFRADIGDVNTEEVNTMVLEQGHSDEVFECHFEIDPITLENVPVLTLVKKKDCAQLA